MPLQSHVLHSGLQLLMNNISAIVAKIPPKVFTFFVLWVSLVLRGRELPQAFMLVIFDDNSFQYLINSKKLKCVFIFRCHRQSYLKRALYFWEAL